MSGGTCTTTTLFLTLFICIACTARMAESGVIGDLATSAVANAFYAAGSTAATAAALALPSPSQSPSSSTGSSDQSAQASGDPASAPGAGIGGLDAGAPQKMPVYFAPVVFRTPLYQSVPHPQQQQVQPSASVYYPQTQPSAYLPQQPAAYIPQQSPPYYSPMPALAPHPQEAVPSRHYLDDEGTRQHYRSYAPPPKPAAVSVAPPPAPKQQESSASVSSYSFWPPSFPFRFPHLFNTIPVSLTSGKLANVLGNVKHNIIPVLPAIQIKVGLA